LSGRRGGPSPAPQSTITTRCRRCTAQAVG
jgi:hypothetical protein